METCEKHVYKSNTRNIKMLDDIGTRLDHRSTHPLILALCRPALLVLALQPLNIQTCLLLATTVTSLSDEPAPFPLLCISFSSVFERDEVHGGGDDENITLLSIKSIVKT